MVLKVIEAERQYSSKPYRYLKTDGTSENHEPKRSSKKWIKEEVC